MTETKISSRESATGCVRFASLFQDQLLEEPPSSTAPAAARRRYAGLVERAGQVCADCPLQNSCLYSAVVDYDVAGFVGGTTVKQRQEMRRILDVDVKPEDFESFAGVSSPNRPVDHDEVVRLRRSNPNETLESIAERLGCSLSTVKRHLRKARTDATEGNQVRPVAPPKPSVEAVLTAAEQVRRPAAVLRRAA